MNPLLLLGAAALVAMAMGGKKTAAKPVKVVAPESDRETAAIQDHAEAEHASESDGASAPSASSTRTSARPSPSPSPEPVPAVYAPELPSDNAGTYTVKTSEGKTLQPNPAQAKRAAQATADHVRNKGTKYSRPMLAAWQALAGLTPDGLYGPATVKVLRGAGAKNVVGPMFKGAN